jgi:hypothetical protein
MSFSLKREIEFYVNDIDSTDGVQKLAILPEFELQLEANLLQVFRKTIGEDPEMLPRSAVDQISPVSLQFITYLKPVRFSSNMSVSAPEKILYDSLGGIQGYRGLQYYKPQFNKTNRLLPLYIFIKTTTAIYKISLAYVSRVEISFDINYILTAKWSVQAISINAFDIKDIIFTNILDYSNTDVYLRNKFTKTNILDYSTNTNYFFPIVESSIVIENSLMPVYDKNVKVITGYPKDLIIGGRSVSGEIKSYLSTRSNHSKSFLEEVTNDLTKVNRKYLLEYIVEDGDNSITISFPRAIINVPSLDFEDVLVTSIKFTSSETDYGANDDIDIKYRAPLQYLSGYQNAMDYLVAPDHRYKLDEASGSVGYDSYAPYNNLSYSGSTFTYRITGPTSPNYGTIYGISPNNSWCVIKQAFTESPSLGYTASGWVKSKLTSIGFVRVFTYHNSANNRRIELFYAYNGVNTTIRLEHQDSLIFSYVINGYNIYANWTYFQISIDLTNRLFSIKINNILVADSIYNVNLSNSNISPGKFYLGCSEYFQTQFSYFADWIVQPNVVDLNLTGPTILYNTFISNDAYQVPDGFDVNQLPDNSDYNDSLVSFYGSNKDYSKAILKSNPTNYWRLNDSANIISQNQVSNYVSNRYLVTYNKPNIEENNKPPIKDRDSKSIKLSSFNGNKQYLNINSAQSLPSNKKYSISFWFKYYSTPTASCCFLSIDTPGAANNFSFSYYLTNAKFGISYGSICYASNAAILLNLNTWYHVVLTIDNSSTNVVNKAYVNGVLSQTFNNTHTGPTQLNLNIGNFANRTDFSVSELAYFPRVLSDTEIVGHYIASGVTGFIISIQPTKGHTIFSGNIPTVRKGIKASPIKGQIIVSGNSSYLVLVKNIEVTTGSIKSISNNTPIIRTQNRVVLSTFGTLSVTPHIPIVGRYQVIEPSNNTINIVGNEVTINKIIEPLNSNIYLNSRNVQWSIGRILEVSKVSITINGNNITAILQFYIYKPINTHIYIRGHTPNIYYTSDLIPQLIFI